MSAALQQNIGLVVVAAGRGERAGNDGGPKQYRALGRSTVMAETLTCFASYIPSENIICVIHQDDAALFAAATVGKQIATIVGGATRQASVYEGLKALKRQMPHVRHVMIHDAARPFLSELLLGRIIDAVQKHPEDGILPTIPVAETLKTVVDYVVTGTASRENMHRAQTPQTFPIDAILTAHERAAAQNIQSMTDDAAVFEWSGRTVRIVEGDAANIKLTYKQDFPKDEPMTTLPDVRIGNGYDVHVFGDGDAVMLCGVEIPHTHKLAGHSDADVGLHALTDALLATCGAGDIGDHFPPTDEKWRGAASDQFLRHAARIVAEHGGTVMNVDVTLVLEAPKIAPHRQAMREKLSQLLNIDIQRCSVKATTNEKMGPIGRKEGVLALATASVVYE